MHFSKFLAAGLLATVLSSPTPASAQDFFDRLLSGKLTQALFAKPDQVRIIHKPERLHASRKKKAHVWRKRTQRSTVVPRSVEQQPSEVVEVDPPKVKPTPEVMTAAVTPAKPAEVKPVAVLRKPDPTPIAAAPDTQTAMVVPPSEESLQVLATESAPDVKADLTVSKNTFVLNDIAQASWGNAKTIECTGNDYAVAGDDNELTVVGECKNFSVTGSGNKIVIDNAKSISIVGTNNKLQWRRAAGGTPPTVSAVGSGNLVSAE